MPPDLWFVLSKTHASRPISTWIYSYLLPPGLDQWLVLLGRRWQHPSVLLTPVTLQLTLPVYG